MNLKCALDGCVPSEGGYRSAVLDDEHERKLGRTVTVDRNPDGSLHFCRFRSELVGGFFQTQLYFITDLEKWRYRTMEGWRPVRPRSPLFAAPVATPLAKVQRPVAAMSPPPLPTPQASGQVVFGVVTAPPGTQCKGCGFSSSPAAPKFAGYVQTGPGKADYYCGPCLSSLAAAFPGQYPAPPPTPNPSPTAPLAGEGACDFCGRVGLQVRKWSTRMDICAECEKKVP